MHYFETMRSLSLVTDKDCIKLWHLTDKVVNMKLSDTCREKNTNINFGNNPFSIAQRKRDLTQRQWTGIHKNANFRSSELKNPGLSVR